MELWLISKDKEINLSEIVSEVSTEASYTNVCRTCNFSMPLIQSDKRTHLVSINLGDAVQLIHNNVNLFTGIVWSVPRQTNGKSISVNCNGYGIYLKKNSGFYKFNCTPEAAVKQIAKDFNIELGQVAATGNTVKRNFFGNNLYEIIMTMYSLANDKKYMVLFDKNKLIVIEKGEMITNPIKSGINLHTLSYKDTLENMVNKVFVYNNKNVLVDTINNNEDIGKYGILSNHIKTDDKNYKEQANKLLNSLNQEIQVDCTGDTSYAVGKSVMLEEPYTKVKGKFYIDADAHIFKNSLYTNKLTLNFKNLMDEKEAGSYEDKYKEKSKNGFDRDLLLKKWGSEEVKSNGHGSTSSMYQTDVKN